MQIVAHETDREPSSATGVRWDPATKTWGWQSPRTGSLGPNVHDIVRAAATSAGDAAAAKKLGISRQTVAKVAAGLEVLPSVMRGVVAGLPLLAELGAELG
jgi:hypothetical protein